MREFTISKNDAGQRLDKFLTKALRDMPPSLMYKLIRKKKIKLDRRRAEANTVLAEGDTVQLFIAEEFFKDGEQNKSFTSIRPNFTVLYEDANVLLAVKRAGVCVHADAEGNDDSLITHIQAYLCQKGEYDPASELSFAPALCNRIDRNTAGIVIAAKTAEALRDMDEAIREGRVHKHYLCAVHGTPSPREGEIRVWLQKNEKTNTVAVFDKNPPRTAKESVTRYRVQKTAGDLSLLHVELLTGRTHQIRASMAHVGHPLLGDGKYGVNRSDRARGYKYQALCAYHVDFDFPPASPLAYLNGRVFEVPKDDIYFLKEFS